MILTGGFERKEIVRCWLIVVKVGRVVTDVVRHLYKILDKSTVLMLQRKVESRDFWIGSHFVRVEVRRCWKLEWQK